MRLGFVSSCSKGVIVNGPRAKRRRDGFHFSSIKERGEVLLKRGFFAILVKGVFNPNPESGVERRHNCRDALLSELKLRD